MNQTNEARRIRTGPDEVPLEPSQAAGESHRRPKLKLKDLVRYNLQSVRAWLLKEDFQQLWNYESAAWAAKFLDQWCRQVMRSRIEPMKKVARTLRAHRELISSLTFAPGKSSPAV